MLAEKKGAALNQVTFEAVIVPHRSIGRRGLRWLSGVLLTLSGFVAFGLWLAGAWPVIGFTGLEALVALWLIRRHALGRRGSETLILTEGELRIVTADRRDARWERRVPADWLRVDFEERPGRTPALLVRSHGRQIEIAAALGEAEKRNLGGALQEALRRQRQPVFDNPQLREISSPPGPST